MSRLTHALETFRDLYLGKSCVLEYVRPATSNDELKAICVRGNLCLYGR